MVLSQSLGYLWPGLALLFFIFRFEYLFSGPKSYRDFRETGPWVVIRLRVCARDLVAVLSNCILFPVVTLFECNVSTMLSPIFAYITIPQVRY